MIAKQAKQLPGDVGWLWGESGIPKPHAANATESGRHGNRVQGSGQRCLRRCAFLKKWNSVHLHSEIRFITPTTSYDYGQSIIRTIDIIRHSSLSISGIKRLGWLPPNHDHLASAWPAGEVDYLEFSYHLGTDLSRDPINALTRYCVMEVNTELKMLKAKGNGGVMWGG